MNHTIRSVGSPYDSGHRENALAAILTFAANKKRPDFLSEAGLLGDLISPLSVVAGTGFEPVTFRL